MTAPTEGTSTARRQTRTATPVTETTPSNEQITHKSRFATIRDSETTKRLARAAGPAAFGAAIATNPPLAVGGALMFAGNRLINRGVRNIVTDAEQLRQEVQEASTTE